MRITAFSAIFKSFYHKEIKCVNNLPVDIDISSLSVSLPGYFPKIRVQLKKSKYNPETKTTHWSISPE